MEATALDIFTFLSLPTSVLFSYYCSILINGQKRQLHPLASSVDGLVALRRIELIKPTIVLDTRMVNSNLIVDSAAAFSV